MVDAGMDEPPVSPSGTLGRVKPQMPGSRTHMCISCSLPILIYGRLYPCLHAFCLACATDMSGCFLCNAEINRIERWPKENSLYISPATLQSFKLAEDLANHTRKVQQHLSAAVLASDRKVAAARKEREAASEQAQAQGRRNARQGMPQAQLPQQQPQIMGGSMPLPPEVMHGMMQLAGKGGTHNL